MSDGRYADKIRDGQDLERMSKMKEGSWKKELSGRKGGCCQSDQSRTGV
jgi:hypothetical protein